MGINIAQAVVDVFDGKAEQDVLDFIEGEFKVVKTAVQSSPAVQAAVTSFEIAAMDAFSELQTWAGTAADGALQALTTKGQAALAPLLTEFAAAVGIPTAGPLGVSETVLVQAALAAVRAAGHAAVASAIPLPAPVSGSGSATVAKAG